MRVVCVMDSVSRANGGIFEAERKLQARVRELGGVDVRVLGLEDRFSEPDRYSWQPIVPVTHQVDGLAALGYSRGYFSSLKNADADIAYGVGLWKYPAWAALRWSQYTGRPLVVAPHGMLDAWALQNSRIKKRLAGWLFQNAQLRRASCIRALCEAEARSIREYGLTNPIAIVPNGVDMPGDGAVRRGEGERGSALGLPGLGDRKLLLYLGRLHRKKGLLNLIRAWALVRPSECVLAIAGWDQGGHEEDLKRLCSQLALNYVDVRQSQSATVSGSSIAFLGPRFGDEKAVCYASCDGFILPSLSEGLPMVVLEAWAYGKATLITPQCNLPQGFSRDAAIRIDPTVEGIAAGLEAFLEASVEQMVTMGINGRALVEREFSWERCAREMIAVYKWTLGNAEKPASIVDVE